MTSTRAARDVAFEQQVRGAADVGGDGAGGAGEQRFSMSSGSGSISVIGH
ncbi:hypothetical protein [Streptomyces sp. NPDC020742]